MLAMRAVGLGAIEFFSDWVMILLDGRTLILESNQLKVHDERFGIFQVSQVGND